MQETQRVVAHRSHTLLTQSKLTLLFALLTVVCNEPYNCSDQFYWSVWLCVRAAHFPISTPTGSATRNIPFIEHTTVMAARGYCACARARTRPFPFSAAPTGRTDRVASETKQIQLAAYDFAFKDTLDWAFHLNVLNCKM